MRPGEAEMEGKDEWELRERRRVRPNGAEREGAALVSQEDGESLRPGEAQMEGKDESCGVGAEGEKEG